MTIHCRKCKQPIKKGTGIRQGVSHICVDCVQIPKTIDCYNDVVNDDNFACRVCGTKYGSIQVHHVVYRSQGGKDEYTNLITLCQRCHAEVHASPRERFVPYFEKIIKLRILGDKGTRVPELWSRDEH